MNSYRAALVNERSTVMKAWYQAIPRLAGYRETALDDCQDIDAQLTHLPKRMRVWYQAALAYICEQISAEELLVQADHRRTRECETFFLAGVWSLGFGDRDQAIKHFQRAVQTRVFEYWDWDWSRLLLEKLRQDPSWPPWIPVADDAMNTTRPSGSIRSDE